jgi:intracellular multiplication protein IcmK
MANFFRAASLFFVLSGIMHYAFAQPENAAPAIPPLVTPSAISPPVQPPLAMPPSVQPPLAMSPPMQPPLTSSPTVQPSPTSSPEQLPLNEFQQWLQNNGYAQNSSGNASAAGSLNQQMPGNPFTNLPPRRHRSRSHVMRSKPLTYEQSQRAMLHSLPAPRRPPTDDDKLAFDMMMQQNMPMTPQQVVELRQQIDVAQRAASTPPVIPPKPVSTTLMMNLAPGTTPPAVRLAQGYVSSLVFVDSTGSPWPIASFDIGNPKAMNIQWDGKSNIILLQAISPYSDGNMVIKLLGLPTPITLELVAGQRVVDFRVDIHVPGIGPNTKELPMGTALPNSANQLLLGVLDGVAPAGSKVLMVTGADAQAWQLGDEMYLRTRMTVLSPGWIGKMVSSDGTQAYELPKTSSVLVSKYGEPAELKIEGF